MNDEELIKIIKKTEEAYAHVIQVHTIAAFHNKSLKEIIKIYEEIDEYLISKITLLPEDDTLDMKYDILYGNIDDAGNICHSISYTEFLNRRKNKELCSYCGNRLIVNAES